MQEKIYGTIAISNRHVHLTKETYELLLYKNIKKKKK